MGFFKKNNPRITRSISFKEGDEKPFDDFCEENNLSYSEALDLGIKRLLAEGVQEDQKVVQQLDHDQQPPPVQEVQEVQKVVQQLDHDQQPPPVQEVQEVQKVVQQLDHDQQPQQFKEPGLDEVLDNLLVEIFKK